VELHDSYVYLASVNESEKHHFTARAYVRAVSVVILFVRPSVCLSHAWIVTKLA